MHRDGPHPRPLTPKQAKFVAEYLIDLNATQAAIRANYSPKNARFSSLAAANKSQRRGCCH